MYKFFMLQLSIFVTSFVLIHYCQAQPITYIASANGLSICDSNFKGCKNPFLNNTIPSTSNYIYGIFNNQLFYISNELPQKCILDPSGNISNCAPSPLGGNSNPYFILNNILYAGPVDYIYYNNDVLSYAMNEYDQGNPEYPYLNFVMPIAQVENNTQYAYALVENNLTLLKLNVAASSFNVSGSAIFNNSTTLMQSESTIREFNEPTSMTFVEGDSQTYLYVAENDNIETCTINMTNYSLSDCEPHAVNATPISMYIDHTKYVLDVVYSDHIDQCDLSSSGGSVGACSTKYAAPALTSIGFYNTTITNNNS